MLGSIMFKIGDFSKLCRVPVKTLRYYDEIGLLKPTGVDRFTRYRYYSLEQLPTLYRILGLKELGFSLEQIGQLLEGEISPEQLRRMLIRRRVEVEQQMEDGRKLLQQIDTRIKEIEQAGRMPDYEILLKRIEPQWVAAVSGILTSYDEAERIFDVLFAEIFETLQFSYVRSPGITMAIYPEIQRLDENIPIEAAYPLPGPLPSRAQVTVYELPCVETAACVVHHGPFTTLGKAYSAIFAWLPSNGCHINGPTREVYLRHERGGDPNQFVTEIQIPVKHVKERLKMEPKIVNMDKFYIVGLPYIGDNEHQEISEMWGVFNQRAGEIKHLAPVDGAYGMCYPHPTARMEYVAAFKVTELADIPDGMVGKEVPAQTYVVFQAQGLDDIGPTYHKIMQEWLPGSGYQAGDGPDFELYNEEFDPVTASGTLYIYFPIKKT
ncbi:MAG: MerR family transcriptional regulator [Chloroflexi bacterium]|nr:MerR family transcriptional regulator [Chloroflexota bacterium]